MNRRLAQVIALVLCATCARYEQGYLDASLEPDAPDNADGTDRTADGGPCEGGECTSPPPNECEDASHMRVYESPGACIAGTCLYDYRLTECAHGCVDGACVSGPCEGVECDSPPDDECLDASTLRDFADAGTCVDGECEYGFTDVDCSEAPADTCLDATTLRDYTGPGTCDSVSASCNLPHVDSACPRYCLSGACVECRDDGDCTGTEVCSSSHECESVGCPPPLVSCTTGTENRRGCSGARTIGRTTAATGTGYSISDSTCYAYDEFDSTSSSCWDAGSDHAYRIYMRSGESMAISVYADWGCVETWWDMTLQIFQNSGCSDTSCSSQVYCEEYITSSHSHTFVAPHDGWFVIVVDGTTAFDDEGDYDLGVRLTCLATDCEC